MSEVIYDFGANRGNNIAYYLLKSKKVVAVEANPALAKVIASRFAKEIAEQRLCVENVVLSEIQHDGEVPFYVHKINSEWSQFPKPQSEQLNDFSVVHLKSRTPAEIVKQHGQPLYIKVDVEHYDEAILRNLAAHQIRPKYLSAEMHSFGPFAQLAANFGYSAFQLLESSQVGLNLKDHVINSLDGQQNYRFEVRESGPFGNDLPGEWLTAEDMAKHLAEVGYGWRDMHATAEKVAYGKLKPLPPRTLIHALVERFINGR
jgi:FkbM family methyltransferase